MILSLSRPAQDYSCVQDDEPAASGFRVILVFGSESNGQFGRCPQQTCAMLGEVTGGFRCRATHSHRLLLQRLADSRRPPQYHRLFALPPAGIRRLLQLGVPATVVGTSIFRKRHRVRRPQEWTCKSLGKDLRGLELRLCPLRL